MSKKKKRPTVEIDPDSTPSTVEAQEEEHITVGTALANAVFRMEAKLTRECEEARKFRKDSAYNWQSLEKRLDAFAAKTDGEIKHLHEELGAVKARIAALEDLG